MHELGGTYMAFDKEKFADLIVRECAKIAAYQGACMPEYKILKHFGVEE
jgi:tellurite resistance protein